VANLVAAAWQLLDPGEDHPDLIGGLLDRG
jgi:hypothetical protein